MAAKKQAEGLTSEQLDETISNLDADDVELLAKLRGAPQDVASVVLQAQPFGTRAALEAYGIVEMRGRPGSQTLAITDLGWQVIGLASSTGRPGQARALAESERRAYGRMEELGGEPRPSHRTVASAQALSSPASLGGVAQRSRAFGRRVHRNAAGDPAGDPAGKDRSRRA
jgi:hypothetical protein